MADPTTTPDTTTPDTTPDSGASSTATVGPDRGCRRGARVRGGVGRGGVGRGGGVGHGCPYLFVPLSSFPMMSILVDWTLSTSTPVSGWAKRSPMVMILFRARRC